MADDFFEDDIYEEKPTPKKPTQKKSKGDVKGKDDVKKAADGFFEDDVTGKTAKKSAQSKGGAAAAVREAKGTTPDESFTFNLGQKVDLTWVIAVAIAAFTIGFVAHAIFFKPAPDTSGQIYNSGAPNNTGASTTAPPLSQDQLKKYEKSGGLPPGHPNLNGSGSATSTGSTQGQSPSAPSGGN
ncbi:MAG: hypothetical protein M1548_02495 [Actinobacteria bacterium]|nr:hypothetical protein [Actinomycetota bacterium]